MPGQSTTIIFLALPKCIEQLGLGLLAVVAMLATDPHPNLPPAGEGTDWILNGGPMAIMQEFKAFITHGNVIDLAVGVIIGAAFNKIVDSLVQDIIMPVVGKMFGGLDFANYYIPLNHQDPSLTLIEAKKLGAVLAYGNFVTIILNFLILAFIIFQMVRLVNRLRQPAAVEAAPTPEDVVLLREIRDSLRSK